MKYASMAIGGALVLYLLGIAVSKPIESARTSVPLDLAGIDTLEIIAGKYPATIAVAQRRAATMSYAASKSAQVTITRRGNIMQLSPNFDEYGNLKLVVSPAIKTLVVGSAQIESEVPLDSLSINATGSISWKGQVGSKFAMAGAD